MKYEDWVCRDCEHACEKWKTQNVYCTSCKITGHDYGNVKKCPDKRKAKDG